MDDDEKTFWPTFRPCPKCGEMTATNGTRTWYLKCEWSSMPDLFTDNTDQ